MRRHQSDSDCLISLQFTLLGRELPYMLSRFMQKKYKMTISRLTVDKLGVKLYDRVSAVIAEVVANSYDADATEVIITAPMGEWLARKEQGKVIDKAFTIQVSDDGSGMLVDDSVNEINDFYLKVGAERRRDPRRGDKSKKFGRRVMGRKGVGKLAPFGVCGKIEVVSSSGSKRTGVDANGKQVRGFSTSHLIMDRTAILWETDQPYYPQPGPWDETVRPKTGTSIKMEDFDHRRVPTIADFERQLAQRFGLSTPHWRIVLRDSQKNPGDDGYERVVGEFETQIKPGTKIVFQQRAGTPTDSRSVADFEVIGPEGVNVGEISAGFVFEDEFYPVTGWVGYATQPYRDDLMAGVRIYCRGKIAAKSPLFNLNAGFTGEHDVRSYLIGELHADWLDEDDDLIRTDRQDILWSHDLGRELQGWGQSLVKLVGRITREPMRKSAWERFQQISKIQDRVAKAYPGVEQEAIRKRTLDMAETIAKSARGDELEDEETIESFVQLSLLLGPHITLDDKLKEAAGTKGQPLQFVSEVLRTARIAELVSFGRIAEDRIRVITQVETYKDDSATLEGAFQKLISEAPWLINPQWSPLAANQSFETLKEEFKKFYKERTGQDLELERFSEPGKRADFVMSNQDQVIEIVEIKRPHHTLTNEEMERINKYVDLMDEFLSLPGNKDFKDLFPHFHVTLVCDKIGLTGVHRAAFDGLANKEILEHINWRTFLLRTRKMHEAFLNEAARQRQLAMR
jgi:hypothetical protein